MNNIKTYINILIDALDSKIRLLNQIGEVSRRQEQLIAKEELDLDTFENLMDKKQGCIDEINIIDTGFQSTYDRIKEQVAMKSKLYSDEIKQLKMRITEVSDLSIEIQTIEQRNKMGIQKHFQQKKSQVKNFKKSRQTATSYYKNMNNIQETKSYFLDRKK